MATPEFFKLDEAQMLVVPGRDWVNAAKGIREARLLTFRDFGIMAEAFADSQNSAVNATAFSEEAVPPLSHVEQRQLNLGRDTVTALSIAVNRMEIA